MVNFQVIWILNLVGDSGFHDFSINFQYVWGTFDTYVNSLVYSQIIKQFNLAGGGGARPPGVRPDVVDARRPSRASSICIVGIET